jgi:hypothetical protein
VLTPVSELRWSFSQWEAYNTCPQKWHFASVLKLPKRPPGPAAARGLDMHKRCEDYINGQITTQQLRFGSQHMRFGQKKPAIIAEKYVSVLDGFRDHTNGDRHNEMKLSFDYEWQQAGGPSAGKAWVIAVLDAARVMDKVVDIGEWKSGQPKDTHADQRKLYALAGLRRWLGVEEVRVTTYYLEDTAPPARLVVKASAEEKLKALWHGRVEQMANDDIRAPRPGDYCKWMCDYAASKGGPCVYGT